MIFAIKTTRTAALFISHVSAVVARIFDEVIVIRNGKTVEHGSAKQITEEPRQAYTSALVDIRRQRQNRKIPGKIMAQFAQWDSLRASEIVTAHAGCDGATLPILHALQEEFGFVSEDAIPLIASALNLSRAEVHGVVTFYHDFRHKPPGRHILKLCRAEACQAMGGSALADALLRREGVEWGGTTPDGALTVEPVYCLGLCACAPASLYDGEPVGRLDGDILESLVREARGA
jgi:formate dehydrogenase subunit gamma